MENSLSLLFDDLGCPSSSFSSGIEIAGNFDLNCDWNNLYRLSPIDLDPGDTLERSIEKLIYRTCLARKCLMTDEFGSNMDPHYAWGESLFVALSENNKKEVNIIEKNGRDSFMIGLHQIYDIKKMNNKNCLHWSDILSISKAMDEMFFDCLDMMANMNGLILPCQDSNMAANINSAFSSVESKDLTVSKLICNPCHSYTLSLGNTVGTDLNVESLQREWFDAGSLGLPHIWTSDIHVSSYCPEDRLYILPEPQYLGVTPIRDNCHGVAIHQNSFSVLKL